MRTKVDFDSDGTTLSGALELPDDPPRCFAVFAHCFTCGKDVAAASRIARALTDEGIAVLRFDFTGLGNSDGDFANSNFSSNIRDLFAAVSYLREHHEAPRLLIGHSLGGSAVLAMAADVPEVDAVVTIGSPYRAEHVTRNFGASLSTIAREGEAEVSLGGRSFTIKQQFIDDLDRHATGDLGDLRKALLVMHSPLDRTVAIDEAEKIYRAARHPKSFVSLDDADHLLSDRRDSQYVAATIAAWASRYLPAAQRRESARPALESGDVYVDELDHRFALNVYSDTHHWFADEPRPLGGTDRGPDPYEHLLAALGTCTVLTLRLYAQHKKLSLDHIGLHLRHGREHLRDCEDCEESPRQLDVIDRTLTLRGDLSDAQRQRLMEIADRCPVHRTLQGGPRIRTQLQHEAAR